MSEELNAVTTPSEETAEQTQVESTPAENKAFLKVKFNHEEKDLDENTARELAQKGMNYDKVNTAFEEYKTKHQPLYEAAKAEGYDSLEGYIYALKAPKIEPVPTVEEAMQKYLDDGQPDTTARTLAELEIEKAQKKRNEAIEQAKADMTSVLNKKKEKQIALIKEKFPDFTGEVSEEFKTLYNEKLVNEDMTFAEAVYDSEYNKLKKQLEEANTKLKALGANVENAAATTGSVKDNGGEKTYFTREEVENMTPEEIKKNYEKITKSMKNWKKE
jgi:hypothetical protein